MMMRDKVKNIINNAQQLLCHRCTGATREKRRDSETSNGRSKRAKTLANGPNYSTNREL